MPAQKKILLVDDSATVLLMERMVLSKDQYEVVTAHDGEEGVAKARSEHPDLILMDVVMPKVDGFEAVRRIKSDPATRSIPIVMVSTKGERENVANGFKSGAADYLTKPIDAPALLRVVKKYVG
jgi:CheY-like chemotaxis protein